jgi:hypothetical protein
MLFPFFVGNFLGADMPTANILPVEANGLTGDGVTDNRALIQAQWDSAAAAGKALSITVPGVYALTATGSGSARYCLTPTTAANRYALLIGPGVTLKIANGQATPSNPVKLIRFVDHTGGLYVGWPHGGKGGTLSGNTAGQTAWVAGYGQVQGNSAISGDDTNGGGSLDVVVEHIYIDDFFSNSVVIGFQASGVYGAGTERVFVRGIKTTNCGEGIVLACVDYFGIEDCEDIRALGKMQGDSFEPAFCRYGHMERIKAHANGDGTVGGGAGIDCYGSRFVTVSDFVVKDCRNGVTLESDFSSVDGYCDEITVSNGVISGSTGEVSPGVKTSTIGIIPSQGGRSTFSNILVENYYSSAIQCVAQTVTDSSPGCDVHLVGVTVRNCATSVFDVTSGDMRLNMRGVVLGCLASPATTFACSLSRNSGSKTLTVHWVGGGGYGFTDGGLRVTGNTFQPVGRLAGLYFPLTGGAIAYSLASTCDLRNMRIESFDTTLGIVRQGVTTFTSHGRSVLYFDAAGGTLVTLPVGTNYARMTVLFLFEGGTIADRRTAAGSGGNIRLRGGTDRTFVQFDSVDLLWVNQTSEWIEVGRSESGAGVGNGRPVTTNAATSITITSTDTGKVIETTAGTAVAVTLAATAAVGTQLTVTQYGAGQITFAPTGSGTLRNRSSHTKSAGQYAVVTLYVRANSGGSAAEWVMDGDTAA